MNVTDTREIHSVAEEKLLEIIDAAYSVVECKTDASGEPPTL